VVQIKRCTERKRIYRTGVEINQLQVFIDKAEGKH